MSEGSSSRKKGSGRPQSRGAGKKRSGLNQSFQKKNRSRSEQKSEKGENRKRFSGENSRPKQSQTPTPGRPKKGPGPGEKINEREEEKPIRSLTFLPGQGRKGEYSQNKPLIPDAIRSLKKSISGDQSGSLEENVAYRINRYLSLCGLGSRREVETLILEKRVQIDGKLVENLNTRVEPGSLVFLDDRPVRPPGEFFYYVMNKPAGITVSKKGFLKTEKTIYDLLPESLQTLKYAGRLDRESRGLLVLSTDGDFIQYITHPSRRILKKYVVTVRNLVGTELELRDRFIRGVEDGGELLRVVGFTVIDRKENRVEIVLGDGKNRHIRRMFQSLGMKVIDLCRISIGHLNMKELDLSEGEIKKFDPAFLLSGKTKKAELEDSKVLGDFNPWKKDS